MYNRGLIGRCQRTISKLRSGEIVLIRTRQKSSTRQHTAIKLELEEQSHAWLCFQNSLVIHVAHEARGLDCTFKQIVHENRETNELFAIPHVLVWVDFIPFSGSTIVEAINREQIRVARNERGDPIPQDLLKRQ